MKKKDSGFFSLSNNRIRVTLIVLAEILFFIMAFCLGMLYEQKGGLNNQELESLIIQEKKNDDFTFYNSLIKKEEIPKEPNIALMPLTKKNTNTTETETVDKKGGYTIQAFSFRSRKTAIEIAEDLKRRGYDAHTTSIDLGNSGVWHRVMIGHYTSYEIAKKERDRIKQIENIDVFITKDE